MGKLAEAYVDINVKMDALNAGLSASNARLDQFARTANSLLGTIGVGVSVAGIAKGITEATLRAGDLVETMSKVGQTFGASQTVVLSMADDMAVRFGAVKQTTLDAAAMFGLIAQGAGLAEGESARLAVSLTRLADDASSFFNVPLTVALEKIRAGLVGEAEPLRAFGVMLSETAVKAKALEMNIGDASGKLTEAEKVMVRVKLITEGLNKAQGDHERTLGQLNNQLKLFAGHWENFKTDLGGQVVGPATNFLGGMRITLDSMKAQGFMSTLGDRMLIGLLGSNGLLGNVGRSGLSMLGVSVRAAEAREKATAEKTFGIDKPTAPVDRVAMTQQKADEAWEAFVKAYRASEEKQFQARRFEGSGFGAFGMLGNIGQEINRQAALANLDARIRKQEAGAWGGGFGAMGAMDFIRAAQATVNQPRDETARAQLEELRRIREAVSRPTPGVQGVVLRGPA